MTSQNIRRRRRRRQRQRQQQDYPPHLLLLGPAFPQEKLGQRGFFRGGGWLSGRDDAFFWDRDCRPPPPPPGGDLVLGFRSSRTKLASLGPSAIEHRASSVKHGHDASVTRWWPSPTKKGSFCGWWLGCVCTTRSIPQVLASNSPTKQLSRYRSTHTLGTRTRKEPAPGEGSCG